MLKRCNFTIKEASKWYQIKCAKKKYKVQRNKAKKIRNNATPNVLPNCCEFAQNQEPRAWLVASFWFEQRPPPSKALVSTLSHQKEVQNNNYSLVFKAKTATKPAPKNQNNE